MKKLFLSAILLIAQFSFAGWMQQNSGTTKNLYGVTFNHGNENQVWACGEDGLILYTSNGGTTWIQQNTGTTNTLYAVIFMEVSGSPIVAVGKNGTIIRCTLTNLNWNLISSPTTKTLKDLSEFNFIAVGDSGTIIKSSDTGLTWSLLPSPVSVNLNAVTGIFSPTILGNNGTILRAMGGAGTNWTQVTSPTTENLYGLPLFFSPFIIVGANGYIAKSSNIGSTWTQLSSGFSNKLNSIEYSVNNDTRIYITGDNGLIVKSTNSGANFGRQISGTTANLNANFFYLDDLTGYVVGNNGTILKTTDGGGAMTWVENNASTIKDFTLYQNYPNPFNPSTTIKFDIPKETFAVIKIYNSQGKEVEKLTEGKYLQGSYNIEFNAVNYPSGIYYYKIETESFTETKKMILIK
jgi:photosystem II stability/assembly factor-like uncharacterized protein